MLARRLRPLSPHPEPAYNSDSDVMQSPPLQPGPRKLKKAGDKDKLKNRMSMVFRKPFGGKDKNRSPMEAYPSPPQYPPAYSAGSPSAYSRPSGATPAYDPSRPASNGKSSRPNKPVTAQSEGAAPRRSHVGAVGSSPPLPPIPRGGSLEGPTDPRVTALLGGNFAGQMNELLPRNSFGPVFAMDNVDGLGIGIERSPPAASPPSLQVSLPPARSSPPHAQSQPQIRSHDPPHSAQQSPPPQLHHHHTQPNLHHQRTPSPRLEQHQGPPPVLARAVSASEPPQDTYFNRRLSLMAQGGEVSAASKRLSMMRRGPPLFGDSSANSSTSTLDIASAASQAIEQPSSTVQSITPPNVPVAKVLLDENEVGEMSAASRDRIAKLRTSRASISAAPPTAAQISARGANRKDATKAFTLAAAPQGFDVALARTGKSTFTPAPNQPLRPVTAPAAAPRPSPLGAHQPVQAAPQPPPVARSKDMYVLRPTISMATQTPGWPEPQQLSNRRKSSVAWATSTPPQAYSSFPPPPPAHDSPPQRQISPSIYSISSFDARSRNLRGHRGGRSSFYANGENDPNEEDEDEYGYQSEEEPPLPDETADNIERHIAAFEQELYAQGEEADYEQEMLAAEATPVNYDIPYLTAESYDTPHLLPFDIPPTPAPLAVPGRVNGDATVPSPALTASGPRTPNQLNATPTPHFASTFSTPQPFRAPHASALSAALDVPESPRSSSRSRGPAPAHDAVPPLSRSLSSSSGSSSSEGETVSSRPPSSLSNRRSSSEPTTPPTSAVSSTFTYSLGEQISAEEAKKTEVDPDGPVVTIRKASIVTSQVRKASLISSPASRPQSIVLRKGSLSSLANDNRRVSFADSDGGVSVHSSSSSGAAAGTSPRGERSPRHFHLDLPGTDEAPPVPGIPSPIRREFGDASYPFPSPTHGVSIPAAAEASEDGEENAQSDVPTPTAEFLVKPSTLLSTVDFDSVRPASAPPEESVSLPLRRQSESDKPIPRARTPGGMMSREERAARGRSYFLVQALMGEVQPDGMLRDWADDGEETDDEVSLMGESDEEVDMSEEYRPDRL
ncbi:hypothetical protein JCM11641_004597 [Rhodosporidiobolus odoratus]